MSFAESREFLLDVSRLVWRLWSGRLPTGIDRVCLAYVEHFGGRSQAVVQFKGRVLVLSPTDSDRLFALVREGGAGLRLAMVGLAPVAWARARRKPPRPGVISLNVGHTGLHDPELPKWVERHGVKAVYLVHDLIPITHPQFCRAGEAAKHKLRMRNALVSATGIVGNSQATIDDLAVFAAEEGLPMPASVAAWISGPDLPEQITPKTLDRPHFVTLGTIEARKNHMLLLHVWQALVASMGESAPILLIIGQRGWEAEGAIAILDDPRSLQDHIRELGRCDDDELAGWLAGARALLMPSFVEGFGLPLVEALQLGTPVIANDLSVYREIVCDLPTYLDPADVGAWERAVRTFLTDSPERTRQLEAIRGYRAPDWAEHFDRIEQWLQWLSSPCNNRAVV